MVVVLDYLLQGPGHQNAVPGVQRVVAEVGCVVLADLCDAVGWTLAQCGDK